MPRADQPTWRMNLSHLLQGVWDDQVAWAQVIRRPRPRDYPQWWNSMLFGCQTVGTQLAIILTTQRTWEHNRNTRWRPGS